MFKKMFVVLFLLVAVSSTALADQGSPLGTPSPEPVVTPGAQPTPEPDVPAPTPGDSGTLRETLLWIFGGNAIGAGVLGYEIMKRWEWAKKLSPKRRRYLGLGLPALLALPAFAMAVAMGYVDAPSGAQAWGEMLYDIGFSAVSSAMLGQVLHGRTMSSEPRATETAEGLAL